MTHSSISLKAKDTLYKDNSMGSNEYYQLPPHKTIREHTPSQARIDLPHFYVKDDVEAYLIRR